VDTVTKIFATFAVIIGCLVFGVVVYMGSDFAGRTVYEGTGHVVKKFVDPGIIYFTQIGKTTVPLEEPNSYWICVYVSQIQQSGCGMFTAKTWQSVYVGTYVQVRYAKGRYSDKVLITQIR